MLLSVFFVFLAVLGLSCYMWNLIPWPGIEPRPPALGAPSLKHWTTREVLLEPFNLAWKIPWMEEPGRLQSMGSLRVGHDWATSLSLFTFMHWRRNGNPLQCSCLKNPRDSGAWWAAIFGVTQSRTRLKRLSSSSSIHKIYTIHWFLNVIFFHLFPYSWSFSLTSPIRKCHTHVQDA